MRMGYNKSIWDMCAPNPEEFDNGKNHNALHKKNIYYCEIKIFFFILSLKTNNYSTIFNMDYFFRI